MYAFGGAGLQTAGEGLTLGFLIEKRNRPADGRELAKDPCGVEFQHDATDAMAANLIRHG